MKKIKISHYLSILTIIPILISLGLLYLGQSRLTQVGNYLDKLYRHPYTVNASIKDVKSGILEIQCLNLQDLTIKSSRKVEDINKRIEESIRVLKLSYLGDQSHIESLESKYKLWLDDLYDRSPSSIKSDISNTTYQSLLEVVESINMYAEKKGKDFYSKATLFTEYSINIFIYTVLGSTFLLIAISVFITRRLNHIILAMMLKLKRGGEKILNESNEIAKSSKTLSDETNESASSLQESASSMEELSAMVKNNVTQAHKSKNISEDMEQSAKVVCEKTTELIESMVKISESNQDIASLILAIKEIAEKTKIIDDIVFQTKILSFNASVEAERAGEFGRGFSVVAQEVSNLAKTSGKASTEIANIVKNSIKNAQAIYENNKIRVENGSSLVNNTANLIKKIEEDSANVRLNMEQILSASQDQAAGISQINEAIAQLDQSTQLNASMATQSSNAALELRQQATDLKKIVGELEILVKGSHQSSANDESESIVENETGKIFYLENEKRMKLDSERKPKDAQKIVNGADSWEKI